jgi:hypothetical protein
LESEQVRELKQLQEENTGLKRVVAELTLDKVTLLEVFEKTPDGHVLLLRLFYQTVSAKHVGCFA